LWGGPNDMHLPLEYRLALRRLHESQANFYHKELVRQFIGLSVEAYQHAKQTDPSGKLDSGP